MGIFGQQTQKEDGRKEEKQRDNGRKDEVLPAALKVEPEPVRVTSPSSLLPQPQPARNPQEKGMTLGRSGAPDSTLASGLIIDGKIEGDGNVRIAGHFTGQVNVKGEVAIEPGAAVEGEVVANTVLVAGEVRGHIEAAARVELKESGSFVGDLKAGSLTVFAGSKMRGKVEFGWKDGELDKVEQAKLGAGTTE